MRLEHTRALPERGHLGLGHGAEKEVGHVALKDEVVAVVVEDLPEHADRARDNREDRQHRSDAKRNARDANQGPQPVAAEIGEDEGEDAHESWPAGRTQWLSAGWSFRRLSCHPKMNPSGAGGESWGVSSAIACEAKGLSPSLCSNGTKPAWS